MLDPHLICRAFERAAPGFDEHDFVHAEIRGRLLERLAAIRLDARTVIDLGAGTGAALPALATRFPDADIWPVDLSPAMLAAGHAARSGINADAVQLPLADRSADLVFSNLMLHHCPYPDGVLAETRRILRTPGVFLFTVFGPDTLLQLGRAWASADRYSHIAPFTDMHNVGDALVRAGFAEPVIDCQTLTVTYRSFDKMIADLRHAGSVNATADRNHGLTGRGTAARLRAACLAQADADGRIPLTIDITFGIAWAGEQRRQTAETIEIPAERLARWRRKHG